MVQIARLNEVFYQGFCPEYDVFETVELLYSVYECVHSAFTFGESHSAIAIPKSLITHHGIGFPTCNGLSFKELFGQFIESIITQSRRTDNECLRQKVGNFQLNHHIIDA